MSDPHPLVLQSIEAQGGHHFGIHRCGCEQRARWTLCQYHQGMNDGIEQAKAEVERLRAERDEVAMWLRLDHLQVPCDGPGCDECELLARIDSGEATK